MQSRQKEKYNTQNKLVIGFYARLEPVKGHFYFLKAFKQFLEQYEKNDILLLLAGGNFGYECDYEKKSRSKD